MKQQGKLLLVLSFILIAVIFLGKLFLLKDQNLDLKNQEERGMSASEISLSGTLVPTPVIATEKIKIDFGNNQKVEGEIAAQTAYEALEKFAKEKNIEIVVKQYKYGKIVTKIKDKENSNGNAWIYSVNEKTGQIAADRFNVYPGDKIEWKFTKM
jgi:hypothetical protein